MVFKVTSTDIYDQVIRTRTYITHMCDVCERRRYSPGKSPYSCRHRFHIETAYRPIMIHLHTLVSTYDREMV